MSRLAGAAVVLLAILAWNIMEAGRIARRHAVPAPFRALSGLCGFLVLPALLITVGGASVITSRALGGLGWFGPAIALLVVAQVAFAWRLGLTGVGVAVPLLTFNLAAALCAVVRQLAATGHEPAAVLLVPGHALAQVAALVAGPWAFASPAVVLVPIIAPARAASSTLGRASRIALSTVATALLVAIALRAAPAWRALDAYSTLGLERATELVAPRPRGDLLIGLRLLPWVGGAPSAALLRDDLALAESLAVRVVAVRVRADRASGATLDSLARALEPLRRDSIRLVVAIEVAPLTATESNAARLRDDERAASDAERVVRYLQPDRLVVALPGTWPAEDRGDSTALRHWQRRLGRLATAARATQPALRVLLEMSRGSAVDSALAAWATGRGGAMDGILHAVGADTDGAIGVLARLAEVDRQLANGNPAQEMWLEVRAAPVVEGEEAQRRLVRHVLVWAAAHAAVRGVVLADASDYDRMTGLRAANGRFRSAVAEAAATIRTFSDSSRSLP